MATSIVTPGPIPFASSTENMYRVPGHEDEAPALIINPSASDEAILCAAVRRADLVDRMLNAWARTSDNSEVAAMDVASVTQPIAEEVTILLGELSSRLSRKAKANAKTEASHV